MTTNSAIKDAENTIELFSAVYAEMPSKLRTFVDNRLMEIMMVDLPTLEYVIHEGVTLPAEEAMQTTETFLGALDEADAELPEVSKEMTATIRDCGREIAEAIDRSVKRILLEDEVANRHVSLNITAEHAKLMKCLVDIAVTPEQMKMLDKVRKNEST